MASGVLWHVSIKLKLLCREATLSDLPAAIASNLANGLDVIQAVKSACKYVEAGIKTSTDLGHGNGPINHFHFSIRIVSHIFNMEVLVVD